MMAWMGWMSVKHGKFIIINLGSCNRNRVAGSIQRVKQHENLAQKEKALVRIYRISSNWNDWEIYWSKDQQKAYIHLEIIVQLKNLETNTHFSKIGCRSLIFLVILKWVNTKVLRSLHWMNFKTNLIIFWLTLENWGIQLSHSNRQ